MAGAMARGLSSRDQTRMLFTDSGSGRAVSLAGEVGGEALSSNSELEASADLLVLGVKPTALDLVADEIGDTRKPVLSLLGGTSIDVVATRFPGAPVFRVMPNLPVEVRKGVLVFASDSNSDRAEAIRDLLSHLGRVVELPDSDFDAATAVMGCSPAYLALAVEAIADAGTEAGMDRELSLSMVVEAAAGTAELLRRHEPVEVRRAVASPGGSTEAGLDALEREGGREALEAAVRASLARMRGEDLQ